MSSNQDSTFLKEAIALSKQAIESGSGGPFGCVIVRDGVIVGRGFNRVTSTNDPTAHAEVVAIRDACNNLGTFQLAGCTVYTSCEPCPMCLGAIYWARPDRVVFAATRFDAAEAGFDDDFIYREIALETDGRQIIFDHAADAQAKEVFNQWTQLANKTAY
jgi:guanine deaminase